MILYPDWLTPIAAETQVMDFLALNFPNPFALASRPVETDALI